MHSAPKYQVTFKQFLAEGGAATAEHGTSRAAKQDIEQALRFVEKHTRIPYDALVSNLLGTTAHTFAGKKKDSSDIDVAVEEGRFARDKTVEALKKATGVADVKVTGGNTYSFPVPVGSGKKVQVDLMFTPSEKWARFGYHASPTSSYSGATRNLIIANLMKRLFEKDKDLVVKDDEGNEIVRVRRGFSMGEGLKRLYRVAPMRKDGKGRVALRGATAAEVAAELKKLGRSDKFSTDPDPILDPDKAAEFMFGPGVKAKDALSAEQVIRLIAKRSDHVEILRDAAEDLKRADLPVPAELQALI